MPLVLTTFFINLDRDTDRLKRIERELAEAGVPAERVPAVEGRKVPDWLRSYYGEHMHPGEVGCSASHLKIYKTILDRGLPFALVLEDDAHLDPNFRAVVESVLSELPRDWDVIRLIEESPKRAQVIAELAHGRKLVRYLRVPRSTTGLLVSSAGARKLLTPRVIREPIDVEIRWPWQLDLNVFGVEPQIVQQMSGVDMPTAIPFRSRPVKFNQLSRLRFNVKKMGIANYLSCRFGGPTGINRRVVSSETSAWSAEKPLRR